MTGWECRIYPLQDFARTVHSQLIIRYKSCTPVGALPSFIRYKSCTPVGALPSAHSRVPVTGTLDIYIGRVLWVGLRAARHVSGSDIS